MNFKQQLLHETSYYNIYKFLPWTNSKEFNKMALMSMIIDAENAAKTRLKANIEYFMCTNEFIRMLFNAHWSQPTIDAYFKELEDEGFIETKRVSVPSYNYPPRFVKINEKKLTDLYNIYKIGMDDDNDFIIVNKDFINGNKDFYKDNKDFSINNNYKQELKQEQTTNREYDEDGFSSPVLAASSQRDIETNAPTAPQPTSPAPKHELTYDFIMAEPENVNDYVTPYNTKNNSYVYLSYNDRVDLINKYRECYLPTLKALNEWNKTHPDYKYSSNKKGFENFVQKQGLSQPKKFDSNLSEGSVIARI